MLYTEYWVIIMNQLNTIKKLLVIAKEVKNKNIQASNYRSIGVLYKDLSESDILSKISKESQVVIYDKEKNLQLANTYFKKSLAIYIELKSNENIAKSLLQIT